MKSRHRGDAMPQREDLELRDSTWNSRSLKLHWRMVGSEWTRDLFPLTYRSHTPPTALESLGHLGLGYPTSYSASHEMTAMLLPGYEDRQYSVNPSEIFRFAMEVICINQCPNRSNTFRRIGILLELARSHLLPNRSSTLNDLDQKIKSTNLRNSQ